MHTLEAQQIRLVAMDALKFIDSDRQRFDVIFVDPPYRLGLLPKLLPKLSSHLAEDGLRLCGKRQFFEPGAGWLVWRRGPGRQRLLPIVKIRMKMDKAIYPGYI